MSSYWTSSLVDESTRFCAIRWPVLPLSWWNRTVLRLTAEYSFTGTFTSPNEIAPLHIDLGIGPLWYLGPDFGNERTDGCVRRAAVRARAPAAGRGFRPVRTTPHGGRSRRGSGSASGARRGARDRGAERRSRRAAAT